MSNLYDHVYVINMDRSTQRLKKVTENLNKAGIDFERFVATDGKDIEITNLKTNKTQLGSYYKDNREKTEVKVPYLIKCDPENNNSTTFTFHSKERRAVAGELGLWCSDIKLWKDALKNGYKNIIMFEDDIKVKHPEKLNQQINDFIKVLPLNFDVGFISYKNHSGKLKKEKDLLYKPADNYFSFGAWAVIFSEKGMKKLLSTDTYNDFVDEFITRNRAYENPKKNHFIAFENYYSPYEDFLWSGDIVIGSEMGRF